MPAKTKNPLIAENAMSRARLAELGGKVANRTRGKGRVGSGAAERRQVAEALSVSEIRYRRLFESAKDGILILDAETGKIVDSNPYLEKMLGL